MKSIIMSVSVATLLTAVFVPNIAQAVVGPDDMKIFATDSQGNTFSAYYYRDSNSPTGWSFKTMKTDGRNIAGQRFDVGPPCDSAAFNMRLLIVKNVSTGFWEVSYRNPMGGIVKSTFTGGSSLVGGYTHDKGANIIMTADYHSAALHEYWFYHANPICSA